MHERMRFIEAYLTGFTELASRYDISRRIAHKWLSRHDANGAVGLQDRSRAPINIPHRTTDDIAAGALEVQGLRDYRFVFESVTQDVRRAAAQAPGGATQLTAGGSSARPPESLATNSSDLGRSVLRLCERSERNAVT